MSSSTPGSRRAKLPALQIAAAALFVLMVVGSFEPHYLRILFTDRSRIARYYEQLPDIGTPGYPQFLEEVRARIPRGDSVAILVPMSRWDGGYSYAYYRASYVLAGRTVVPLVDPDDRKHVERLSGADWLAIWNMNAVVPGYDPVWSGAGGTLARHRR